MNTIALMLDAAFGGDQPTRLPAQAGRRRRKVWDLPPRWHCPLVGTCLPAVEMRRLATRCGFDVADMSDYTLHTVVVGSCDKHGEVAEAVQRFFEKRYAAALARFARAKGETAVLTLWREALVAGKDIAGALWAAWSHPDLSEDAGKEMYGDIHMLSHQVGAAARADLQELQALRQENRRLRLEAEAWGRAQLRYRREQESVQVDLRRQLADAEARAALLARRDLELAEARRQARDYGTLFERAEALAGRVETLEERNAANARRAQALETELAASREELLAAESALESALGVCDGVAGTAGCGRSCPAETRLAGRCVLCIGGRTGLVDGYRRLVETRGGRFLHHDGGQEENLHRIDAVVSGADAVVCQAGCISHAAYWRLKEACKKLGKPCVFVQSPGVASFAKGLAALDGALPADGLIGRLAN
jgi:hypothetical protein